MVGRVQDHLEAIYGIRCGVRADQYLLDDEAAARLGGTGRAGEELLVREDNDGLEVGLFLSRALLARVNAFDDAQALLEGDLAGYCEVAEGVSHFLYLHRAASLDRHVSLLELEAQA